jgi:hypothetical protein
LVEGWREPRGRAAQKALLVIWVLRVSVWVGR